MFLTRNDAMKVLMMGNVIRFFSCRSSKLTYFYRAKYKLSFGIELKKKILNKCCINDPLAKKRNTSSFIKLNKASF